MDKPVFDKMLCNGHGDRVSNIRISKPNILIFEGFSVGLQPVPNLNTEANERMKEYLPFWENFDHFIVLQPEVYFLNPKWEKQAEEMLKEKDLSILERKRLLDYYVVVFDENIYYPYLQKYLQSKKSYAHWLIIDKNHTVIKSIQF